MFEPERILAHLETEWDERHPGVPFPVVGIDDNLFDRGIVTSLEMVELITWVEETAGVTIDLLATDPDAFLTVRGIANAVSAVG